MTRDNVAKRLALAVAAAAKVKVELVDRHISPHTIRHYLPNRTMSCNLVTRAVMLGHQIRADQIPVPLPDIVRYLQAVEKGQ